MTDATYQAVVAAHRRRREEGLRDPDGWLTLVGLHWLHEGEQTFGSDPAADVRLEGAGVPPLAGTFVVSGGRVRLVAPLGVGVSHAGAPVGELELIDDREGVPTVLGLGPLRFHLIRRGTRLGIRVRDPHAAALRGFRGLDYFPVDERWRIPGRVEPAPATATIDVPDVLGGLSREPLAGQVSFELGGATQHLAALEGEDEGRLWLIFSDPTNGHETYAAGRFVVIGPVAADASVDVDFNLAYNPPCVFSPYATCPLPPAGNHLAVRVEAGERLFAAPRS